MPFCGYLVRYGALHFNIFCCLELDDRFKGDNLQEKNVNTNKENSEVCIYHKTIIKTF